MGVPRKLQIGALRGVDFSVNGLVVGNDDKARTVNVFEQRFGRKAGGFFPTLVFPADENEVVADIDKIVLQYLYPVRTDNLGKLSSGVYARRFATAYSCLSWLPYV